MRRRCQLKKGAILANQESFAFCEFIVFAAEWIGGEPRPVLFVGGEALDRVDAVSESCRALVRREVADQIGAATRNCLSPVARIVLELDLLGRIDMISDDAGDHGASPASQGTSRRFDVMPDMADASVGIEASQTQVRASQAPFQSSP